MPEIIYSEHDLRDALTRRSLDDGAEPDVTDFRARLGALVAQAPADDAEVEYLSPMATVPAAPDHAPEAVSEATPEAAPEGEVFDLIPRAGRGTRDRTRRFRYLAVAAAACIALGAAGLAVLHGTGDNHSRPTTHTSTLPTRIPSSVPKQIRDSYYPGTQYVGFYSGTGSRTIALPDRPLPKNYQWMGSFTCTGSATTITFGGNQVVSESLCRAGSAGGSSLDPGGRTLRVSIKPGSTWKLWVFQVPETLSSATVTEQADASQIAGYLTKSGTPHLYRSGRGDGTVQIPDASGLRTSRGLTVELSCTGSGVRIDGFTPSGTSGGVYTDTCFAGFAYSWLAKQAGRSVTLHVHASTDTSWRIVVGG